MLRWLADPSPVRWLGASPAAERFQPTKSLADVVSSVRPQFEALLAKARDLGFNPVVRSAGRTCAQQDEQVKLGFSYADLCRGMHVMGHAVDLDLTPNVCASYTALGQWWEARGGVWGGRWKQFGACGDAGHYQYGFGGAGAVPTSVCRTGVTLAQCVEIREAYLSKNLGAPVSERGYNLLAIGTLALVGVVAAVAWARGG